MGEAGRHASRVLALEREGASLSARNAELQTGLEAANWSAYEAVAELGLQMQLLHDTLGLAARRLAILNTTQGELVATQAALEAHVATVADLEARSTGQDLRMRRLMARNAAAMAELKDAHAATATAMLDLGAARAEIARLAGQRAGPRGPIWRRRATINTRPRRWWRRRPLNWLRWRPAWRTRVPTSQPCNGASSRRRVAARPSWRSAPSRPPLLAKADRSSAQPGGDADFALLRQTIVKLRRRSARNRPKAEPARSHRSTSQRRGKSLDGTSVKGS